MKAPPRVWCALLVGTALGCTSDADRATVHRWLLCEECVAGELDSVVALGNAAVLVLGNTIHGPPADRFANVRRQAATSYRSAQEAALGAGATVALSEAQYVRYFLANYVALYQSRSAVALGRIGTGPARNALVEAMRRDSVYRSDVRRAIADALGDSLLIDAGNNQVAPQNTLTPVPPTVRVTSATGAPVQGIRVQFAVDSGGGTIVNSIVYTNAAGVAQVGSWRLGAAAPPLPTYQALRAHALGRSVVFRATATP